MLQRLQLYFNTLRYLKVGQIIWRLWYRVYRPSLPRSTLLDRRAVCSSWVPSPCHKSMMLGENCFLFLNEEHELKVARDWNHPDWSKLWLYNLHYFDDLNAADSNLRVDWHHAYISRWIAENPAAEGNGWEPYPSSLRIVNWIKWSLSGNSLSEYQQCSLTAQIRHLDKQLEWHLLGNHLLANAKALIFGGIFCLDKESEYWLEKGIQIVNRELKEQILADGAHFELSPMYHGIILEDILDLINLMRVYGLQVPSEWGAVVPNMLRWASGMSHPDGEISFFNDAAFNIALSPLQLIEYAKDLGLYFHAEEAKELEYFKNSGYIRMENKFATAILDVANVGSDYLPGHAHADTLSFELSLFGQRVIVNSGTSMYGISSERQRQRATSAHSTVMLDKQNSSEVWGGFRVAKRAKIITCKVLERESDIYISACHDGYERLAGKPIHQRVWMLSSHSLQIEDQIHGEGSHQIEVVFPFHPAVKVVRVTAKLVVLKVAGHEVEVSADSFNVVESTYHPEFGLTIKNNQLVCHFLGELPMKMKTAIKW